MRLNLKSFEACIEKIADGMALDEALRMTIEDEGQEQSVGPEPPRGFKTDGQPRLVGSIATRAKGN